MPTVPQYESQGRPTALPNVSTGTSIPNVNFGRSLATAAAVTNAVYEKEKREADRIAFNIAETQLNGWVQHALFDPQRGAFAKKGQKAFGLPDQVLPGYDKEVERIRGNLTSREQVLAFWELSNGKRVQVNESLNRHEFSEREVFYDETAASALQDSITSAANFFNDPKAIKGELDRQTRVVTDQGRRKSWDPERLKEAIGNAHSLTHLGVVERLVALKDLKGARTYFEAMRDNIRGDHATEIEKMLRTEDASHRESLRLQLADIEAAARNGVPILPSSIPPRDLLIENFGPEAGSRLHDQALAFSDLSREVASMHAMPAEEVASTVENYKPTEVYGAAAAAERHSILASMANDVLSAREKDRAGYLVAHNPVVRNAWEGLFGNEDSAEALKTYRIAVQAFGDELGITNQNIVPEQYANQVVAQLTTPRENELTYQTIQNEAHRWGSMWPKVLNQIGSKLPASVAVIASGIPQQSAIALSSMIDLKQSELAQMVPKGQTMKAVEDEVMDQFEDYLKSFPTSGVKTQSDIFESAVRLTLYYTKGGSSIQEAAKLAYSEIGAGKNSDEKVDEFHGLPYRYPARLDGELLNIALEEVTENLELQSPMMGQWGFGIADEDRVGFFNEYLRQNAYWVTDGDGSGLVLYADGYPVSEVGRPKIKYSWQQLMDIGSKRGRGAYK